MSRSRNIKPGFFTNDLLAELPFEFRLLFIGLWTLADREGRMEDRPTKIRMAIFPADAVDVAAGLQSLHDYGFIRRYEVNGKKLIQIVMWAKHQNPHYKEAKSTLPAPGPEAMVEASASGSSVNHEDKASGEPEASPGMKGGSAVLIPDSLIPDSLQHPTEPNGSDAGASPESPPPDPIWGTGLAFLKRKGIPEKSARSLLGQLRKAMGDIQTGSALAQAEEQDITDPAPWLMAAAGRSKARAGPNGKPSAAADFRNKAYTGTAFDDLPSDLRPASNA